MRIYSRNSENNTSKYPEVIGWLPKSYDPGTVKSFILDAEVVAWDSKSQNILPFQQLSTRKRKDVKESEVQVHVALFVFDLIYLNGKSLLAEPLQRRRELLKNTFHEVKGQFHFAEYKDT